MLLGVVAAGLHLHAPAAAARVRTSGAIRAAESTDTDTADALRSIQADVAQLRVATDRIALALERMATAMEEGSATSDEAKGAASASSSTIDWAAEERSFVVDLDEAYPQAATAPLPGFLTDTSSLDELDARLQEALRASDEGAPPSSPPPPPSVAGGPGVSAARLFLDEREGPTVRSWAGVLESLMIRFPNVNKGRIFAAIKSAGGCEETAAEWILQDITDKHKKESGDKV